MGLNCHGFYRYKKIPSHEKYENNRKLPSIIIIMFLYIHVSNLSVFCTQAEKWGQVEWHHLVEEKDLKSKLGAAILLKELSYKD